MAVLLTQNSDGTTTWVSNVNGNVVHTFSESQGSYKNFKKYVEFEDDFWGDLIADEWSAAAGANAAVVATIVAGGEDGVVRLTAGNSVTVSEGCSSLTLGLNFKADSGGLYMACRIKNVTAVTNRALFVGFTDVLATTTLEEPITLNVVTITATADNAVGFVYDTNATNDTWHKQGVKATTATATANTAVAPTADTYQWLELFVDSSGNATFYIDGVSYGSVANAVTATTALTPCVKIMTRTTTIQSCDVDYIGVFKLRDS